MRVFNLTDMETPRLRQHGLVEQTFVVGGELLAPGASADVAEKDEPIVRRMLEHLIEVGACAIDELPAEYARAPNHAAPRPPAPSHTPETE